MNRTLRYSIIIRRLSKITHVTTNISLRAVVALSKYQRENQVSIDFYLEQAMEYIILEEISMAEKVYNGTASLRGGCLELMILAYKYYSGCYCRRNLSEVYTSVYDSRETRIVTT